MTRAFKRRQFAARRNKENLARPRPVLRPQRDAAVGGLLARKKTKGKPSIEGDLLSFGAERAGIKQLVWKYI